MDITDRKLLNLVQKDFPLVAEPFAELGRRLNITEEAALQRLRRLEEGGIIRWIGAILEAKKLGYQSTLVAMKVTPASLDEVAAVVSQHQGVSHNYARNHRYNLWFTLTVPPADNFQHIVDQFSQQPGVEAAVLLPAVRLFKLNVFFDMVGGLASGDGSRAFSQIGSNEVVALSAEDQAILKELQKNLPLLSRPFDQMAERLGITAATLLGRIKTLQGNGIVRRYCASLHHRRAGFVANAMTCWEIPSTDVVRAGTKIASYPEVTHCYERQVNGDWVYNLFAMIHGRSRQECEAAASKISQDTGIGQHVSLYSTKEYKKERVRFLE